MTEPIPNPNPNPLRLRGGGKETSPPSPPASPPHWTHILDLWSHEHAHRSMWNCMTDKEKLGTMDTLADTLFVESNGGLRQ
jgi:hypothetical protein